MTSIVVHYQELALKGRNRPWFVERLVRNLREACGGLAVEVRSLMGRIEVILAEGADEAAATARIARVFGIANFAVARGVPPDVEAMTETALAMTAGRAPASFRVATTRADKSFPLDSPEIERRVGGRLREAYGWPVNLKHPDMVVRIEVVPGLAFVSVDRQRGMGGLPTGVSGRALCLLSGGIDSPVAAWRLMRRGCRVDLAHFHSYPIVSRVSQEKVQRLAAVLASYQLRARLWLVPFGDAQRRIVTSAPSAVRVVLYRRFMVRIAEQLARRGSARVLVTGEVLGQVASQTIENMAIIDAVADMPVLRPLVGMDKEEITAEARRIGTYDISIVPDEDCCQVFTPKHPATRARREEIDAAEAGLPVDDIVRDAADRAERHDIVLEGIGAPAGESRSADQPASGTTPRA
jgi:tRNA uracil 4-sulfurtransferase